MIRICIDRKAIADNRNPTIAGKRPPIILVHDDGTRQLVNEAVFPGGRVVYQPKALYDDGSPVDPIAAEVWVEVNEILDTTPGL